LNNRIFGDAMKFVFALVASFLVANAASALTLAPGEHITIGDTSVSCGSAPVATSGTRCCRIVSSNLGQTKQLWVDGGMVEQLTGMMNSTISRNQMQLNNDSAKYGCQNVEFSDEMKGDMTDGYCTKHNE
jgi:hypothetical protein